VLKVNESLNLKERFVSQFGDEAGQIRYFFAPGRVNLIGEHTDYTGGYVFPAALNIGTWALVRQREDGIYRLASTNFSATPSFSIEKLKYDNEDEWGNYPKGMIAVLKAQTSKIFSGADILYHGNIPNGSGLSSSASIEVLTGVIVNTLEALHIPMIELVQLAQKAENEFVGVNCGIMDQFAVGMGQQDHAMLLRCSTLDFQHVPFVLPDYKIVITNTNKRRGLADSKYNERRDECEQGFAAIKPYLAETITCLGDMSEADWRAVEKHVCNETVRQRVEHVIMENQRVKQAMEVLSSNDLDTFGKLMHQSHESLRDLYEVTGVELDALYEEAKRVAGCIGTRMTGAGFGGCTVSLVNQAWVERFIEQVTNGYKAKTGLTPAFYICSVGNGASEIEEAEVCLS